MSKIEQIIGEIEEYIDNCRFQPLSNTKITVNKDEINELLDELRQTVPDEVRKYQKMISNRDAILRDAQDKAEEMIRKANEMTSTLVSEHEIMQQAFREANIVIEDATNQAQMIIDNATAEANDIKSSAVQYTDDSLSNIQNILNTAIEGMTVKFDGVMRSLESSLEVASRDRQSLKAFYSEENRTFEAADNDEAAYEEQPQADMAQGPAVGGYVENTFVPEEQPQDADYDDLTVQDVIKDEEIAEPDDTGEDEDDIEDFDLTFDDFK